MAQRASGRGTVVRFAVVVGMVAATVGVVVQSAASKPQAKWVIGVSNTLVGNGWREEMICSVKAQAAANGNVSKVIVANRNGGPAEQSADIRNLISAGADPDIIKPPSPNAPKRGVAPAPGRGGKGGSGDSAANAPQAGNRTKDHGAHRRRRA